MTVVPNISDTRDQLGKNNFSTDSREGNDLGIIQVHYMFCALYFYYYYISSTSDHQALDPRGWGPLP